MITCILIFLASLQIIWAEDRTKILPPSKAEAPPLNPEIKKDIVDLFKRSGPKSVPPSPADSNLEYFNTSPLRNKQNIFKDNSYSTSHYHQPYSKTHPGYGPSNYNGFYQDTYHQPYPVPYPDYRPSNRHRLPLQVQHIPKNVTFSLFRKEHKQALLSLISHFTAVDDLQPNINATIQYLKDVKPYINVYLYQDAVSNFLRKKGLGDGVPPISEREPENFISIQGLQLIIEENMNPTVGRKKRQAVRQESVSYRHFNGGILINQKLDLTGTDHVEEHRVAYFREDYGMNSHHHNWHLEMADGNRVPRRMEYFVYMHAQMIRRYNTERLAVNLPPVTEYSNFYGPIDVGHRPNLGYTRNAYGTRENYMTPSDYVRNRIGVQNRYKRELDNQIQYGVYDDERFMSNLEAYHDDGHGNIARTVINRWNPRSGLNVMEVSTTSARDNVFYRWHQHIDDLYENYMQKIRHVHRMSLQIREMTFDDIELKSFRVESKKRPNELVTGCGSHRVDISNGLDLEQVNFRFIIEMVHLDHVPFSYHIQYNNKARRWKSGVVRIFLAPTNDERGIRMGVEKQRRYWIEMDKFKYNFQPGNNVLERESSESAVTVDCRKVFVGCKFPFIFNNVSYSKCVNPDNSKGPWCSTKTDDMNNHIKDHWKYCDGSDECQFPFRHHGRRYTRCAKWEGHRDWCSTKTDANNNHIDDGRHWKFCNDDPDDRDGHCSCGWPQHLLVPRGTPNGMKFKLFVIVTNERNIQAWNAADNSHSTYCGFDYQVMSDRRPMGFPFHAPAPREIRRIQDFPRYLRNSAVADISIRFHGNPTNTNEEPVEGCGL